MLIFEVNLPEAHERLGLLISQLTIVQSQSYAPTAALILDDTPSSSCEPFPSSSILFLPSTPSGLVDSSVAIMG